MSFGSLRAVCRPPQWFSSHPGRGADTSVLETQIGHSRPDHVMQRSIEHLRHQSSVPYIDLCLVSTLRRHFQHVVLLEMPLSDLFARKLSILYCALSFAYQREIVVDQLGTTAPPVFLNAITATKFSLPNTSSSRQRTRCRFSSLICTKMEPLSLRSSRHKSRRSRR
jgi:hypothetical protein